MKVQEVSDLRLIVEDALQACPLKCLRRTYSEGEIMDIAVVGSPAFTLGFQLAGLSNLPNPDSDDELHSTLRSLLNNKSVGIMVVDSAVMATLPDRLKDQLSASVSPTVLGIGTEEDTTLRDTIRKAIGVDLWK